MVNIKLLFIILDEDLSKQVKYVLNKFGIKIIKIGVKQI